MAKPDWSSAGKFGETVAEVYLGAIYRVVFQSEYGDHEVHMDPPGSISGNTRDYQHEVGMAAVRDWLESLPKERP